MSQVYNPEADVIAEIERIELESREIRQKIKQAPSAKDQEVLSRQLKELEQMIELLRHKIP